MAICRPQPPTFRMTSEKLSPDPRSERRRSTAARGSQGDGLNAKRPSWSNTASRPQAHSPQSARLG
jgi:hypothetical protein